MQTFELEYKEPFRFEVLLKFFRDRLLIGVETADDVSYSRAVRIAAPDGQIHEGWLRVENDEANSCLRLALSDGLAPVAEDVIARVRHQFDLDCDPAAVAEGIASLDEAVPGSVVEGTRMPGAFEPFETACRAVLGQQVSVAAANKLAARIIAEFGRDVETEIDGLNKTFPSSADMLAIAETGAISCEECGKCAPGEPKRHAAKSDSKSAKEAGLESAFGPLGVIRTRARTIYEIARLSESGELELSPTADAEQQMETLLAIKGIGPWTANYIAMRTMAHTDAFLETDVGIKHALPDLKPKERLALAESWRPWRGYANISLWNSLAPKQ